MDLGVPLGVYLPVQLLMHSLTVSAYAVMQSQNRPYSGVSCAADTVVYRQIDTAHRHRSDLDNVASLAPVCNHSPSSSPLPGPHRRVLTVSCGEPAVSTDRPMPLLDRSVADGGDTVRRYPGLFCALLVPVRSALRPVVLQLIHKHG